MAEIKRGLSFQWDEDGVEQHTWFVVTHEKEQQYILLNISSTAGKRFIDDTCVITPNLARYPKIVKDSFVFYRGAKIKSRTELVDILQNQTNRVNPQAPCWLVDTMASGLMRSRASSERIKNHYRTVYSPVSLAL